MLLVLPPNAARDARGHPATNQTFTSVAAAVDAARALPPGPKTIALREGTHYLSETLALGPRDARLTLRNYPGEAATLSGGVPLDLAPSAWRDATAECGKGGWKAALPKVASVPGLRVDGVREIRARFPNFDPELDSVIDGSL